MEFKDGQFYTTEKVGRTREKTPEGYLLCHGVPISRTGEYEYAASDAGMGSAGTVRLTRTAEELFSPDTMRSFEGKPIVIGHDRFATPENWRQVSCGIVQNVRRDGDTLRADLLITDEHAIKRVENGDLTDVSCGYDAEVIDDGNRRGHHTGIVGNHLALVDKARVTGCRIGDGAMAGSIKTILRRIFKDGDEEKFNEILDDIDVVNDDNENPENNEEPQEMTDEEEQPEGDRLSAIEAKLDALTDLVHRVAEAHGGEQVTDEDEESEPSDIDPNEEVNFDEEPEGEHEPAGDREEVVDSDEVQQIMSDADAICEGIKRPVGDAAYGRYTRGAIERFKRNALKRSGINFFGDANNLSGTALDIAFNGAVNIARDRRNPKARVNIGDSARVNTLARINQMNRDFWSK